MKDKWLLLMNHTKHKKLKLEKQSSSFQRAFSWNPEEFKLKLSKIPGSHYAGTRRLNHCRDDAKNFRFLNFNILAICLIIGLMLNSTVAHAFELNLEAQTRITQTEYIQNDIFDLLASEQFLSNTDTIEKLIFKAEKRVDDVQLVFENNIVLRPDQSAIDHIVDNAYFSIANGPLIVYVGKQRIKWGTGYFWNPTDVLQVQKNVFDLTDTLEGILALRMDYSHPWLTPSLIVAMHSNAYTEPASSNLTVALQLYKLIGTMDLFLNAVYWHDHLQSVGTALSWDVDWFIINAEAGAVKVMNKEFSLLHTLTDQRDELHYNYIVGLSRQLGETFFVTAEYYHNGLGLGNHDFDLYLDEVRQDSDWLRFLDANMKKDYGAFNLSYTHDDTWAINLLAIRGLNDGTFYLYPRLSYVENPNYSIELGYFKNYATAINHEGYYVTPTQYAVELRLIGYF